MATNSSNLTSTTAQKGTQRPASLYFLFREISALKGVGKATSERIARASGGLRILDLLWHLPTGTLDRTAMPPLADAPDKSILTAIVTVDTHTPNTRYSKRPYQVQCFNETGKIQLVYFSAKMDYLMNLLPPREQRVISGQVEWYKDTLQMVHPHYVAPVEKLPQIARFEPQYGLTEGLSQRQVGTAVRQVLSALPEFPEWQDPAFMRQQAWPDVATCLRRMHYAEEGEQLQARRRLAYDELLANQLALSIVRQRDRAGKGRPIKAKGTLVSKCRAALPFTLTEAQKEVLKEIINDLAAPARMVRLLQGDVGSGKTIVALLAMLYVIEAGKQAVCLAPTEILARQHAATMQRFITQAGLEGTVRVGLLLGKQKAAAREALLSSIQSGETHIIVGTHAVFQDAVQYHDLGMAVIDEQHRFGVKQRLLLTEKGRDVDTLLLTATPIPRSLALTYYGDVEVSSIREKPAGRLPIDTRAIGLSRLIEMQQAVVRAVQNNEKVYWICPMIEATETEDVAAVEARAATLEKLLPGKVGTMHGRMEAEEKQRAMQAFLDGDVRVLVATTVVEVGVDVPDATIMIIEHANRFGLAQLHQLRGRVGRSDKASSCVLLCDEPLGEMGRRRMQIMRETNDGFKIAEEDLDLRGSGEVLGTRQSGFPAFRIADMVRDRDLLLTARDDAKLVLETDSKLRSPRGEALRHLLYLFEYDQMVKYLTVG